MREFSKLEIIIIAVIFFSIPLVIFSAGIIVLIQEDFSRNAIIMSIWMFGLSVASFFALGLREVFKK